MHRFYAIVKKKKCKRWGTEGVIVKVRNEILDYILFGTGVDNGVNSASATEESCEPCYMQANHQNMLGSLLCHKCNPSGKIYSSGSDSD